MKLNSSTTRFPAAGRTGIDAGHRVQLEAPVTGVRHFRAGFSGVKRAGVANLPELTLHGERAYLRALRAAEMASWAASGGDMLHFSIAN